MSVINPITDKPIKIGGALYKKLIEKGILQPELPKVVATPLKVNEPIKQDTNQNLIKRVTKHSLDLINKVKSGEIKPPDNLDDASIESFIKEQLYISMLKHPSMVPESDDESDDE